MSAMNDKETTTSLHLSFDSVLVQTPWCTLREQEEQDLIYNTNTDEMHLLSKTGTYVYRLCDGITTVGDMVNAFQHTLKVDHDSVKSQIVAYLEKLLRRGALKISE